MRSYHGISAVATEVAVYGVVKMIVRPIEAGDAAAWTEMRAKLWPDADLAELERETAAFLTGGASSLVSVVFIADLGVSERIGFLELAIRAFSDGCDSAPVPHVEGWYVKEHARGRGIGRELMQAAENWARDRGFVELASDTEIHNESSLRAHEACGFEEVERLIKFRKRIVTDDARAATH